jgi:hypothetical protein
MECDQVMNDMYCYMQLTQRQKVDPIILMVIDHTSKIVPIPLPFGLFIYLSMMVKERLIGTLPNVDMN